MQYLQSSPLKQEQRKYGEAFVRRLKKQYHQANVLAVLKKRFQEQTNPAILEFGPGEGELTELLVEAFPKATLTVVDIDPAIVERLAARFPSVRSVCTEDTVGFLHTCGPLDAIVSCDVWEHIPKDVVVEVTRACFGALNKGGVFVAQVPNLSAPLGPQSEVTPVFWTVG